MKLSNIAHTFSALYIIFEAHKQNNTELYVQMSQMLLHSHKPPQIIQFFLKQLYVFYFSHSQVLILFFKSAYFAKRTGNSSRQCHFSTVPVNRYLSNRWGQSALHKFHMGKHTNKSAETLWVRRRPPCGEWRCCPSWNIYASIKVRLLNYTKLKPRSSCLCT